MSLRLRLLGLLAALLLTACTLPRPAGTRQSGDSTQSPAQLLAAVQRDADQIDAAQDARQRAQLAAAATASAGQCLARAPDQALCHYAQAQALGLSAREHPVQAGALLKSMLASLAKAESLDASLDHAGPARLSAVVLLRAPPWPLGPGDVDGAVSAAQRAVKRDPAYPLNLITLAQAQAKSPPAAPALATYGRAQQAVAAWQGDPGQTPERVAAERAQWQRTIEQGLHALQ